MTSVAETFDYVVGVDTHCQSHTFTIVDAPTGKPVVSRCFPATPAGHGRALTWVERHCPDPFLMVVEGIGSYGAKLARAATDQAMMVVEAGNMAKTVRHGHGKTDVIDSARIARSVTGIPVNQLRYPHSDQGIRDALQVLSVARDQLTTDKTRAINALTALVRRIDLGVDARKPLTLTCIRQISRWHPRNEALHLSIARQEAVRLAKRIIDCHNHIQENQVRITTIIGSTPYAVLMDQPGIGPITAAWIITAWGQSGRIRSEAAFAALAGVNPIPVSSGNTERHRLNRGGDRQLNQALSVIAITRMTHDQRTKAYVAKRRSEGRTTREIRRILKRYIAREIYRLLTTIDTPEIQD